jgi:hypothetical protein
MKGGSAVEQETGFFEQLFSWIRDHIETILAD